MLKGWIFRLALCGLIVGAVMGSLFDSVMSRTPAGKRVIELVRRDKWLASEIGSIDGVSIWRFSQKKRPDENYYVNEFFVRVKGARGERHVMLSERCPLNGGGCFDLSMK